MSSILPYLVLLLTASACARAADDDNAKQKAHTLAITKANDAYDYLLQNKVKVGESDLDNSVLCLNKLKESLEQLVEVKDFDAAIKLQQGCANAIKTTSGLMSDVKAKVSAAVKAIQAVNAPSSAPSQAATTVTKAQNNAAIKAAEAYLWLAGQKDNIVESEQELADKCAENIATSVNDINEGDYKSAVSNLGTCANSLQGNRLPVLKEKTMVALSACKATEASAIGGASAQKDPEMVANEAYMWLRNPDNTEKLGKPEKEAVQKCTGYIASCLNDLHGKDYKKAIDSLLNCANSTQKGQLLPEVYKKSMEAANLCQTLKRTNTKANQPAAAPSNDAADAPASSSDGESDSADAPAPSSDGSDDSDASAPSSDRSDSAAPADESDNTAPSDGASAPSSSDGSDDSAAPSPSSDGSDDSDAPASSSDVSDDSDTAAPSPSEEGSDVSDAPTPSPAPSDDGGESDDSDAPSPSSDGGESDDSDAPSPSSDGGESDVSDAPALSTDGGESDNVSDAPAPSSDGSDDSETPASEESDDSAAPAPSSDGSESAAKDTEAQKKATDETDQAYLIIDDNRAELDKLDPNGTDVCFKSLSAAKTNIAEDVYDKAQSELQSCVNALPSPKGQLVDVKAKAEKAIEHLKAQ